MKLLIVSLLSSVILPLSRSEVCFPTWSVLPAYFSFNGEYAQSVVELQICMAVCERKDSCLAIDFDQRSSKPICWLLNSANQLSGSDFQNGTLTPNITRYRIKRNCSNLPEEDSVSVQWERRPNNGSANGIQVGYWTEYDCFTYCRYRSDCVAVDFDNQISPPCWIHTDSNDLNANNVYSAANVVQYRLNKTNSTSTLKQVGRCTGQWFLNDTWCPPEAIIQIQTASFKHNPLCLYRNADDAHPPDAAFLQSVAMQYLDLGYYNKTMACSGNSQCYLRAKCPMATDYSELCSTIVLETNFVLISYTCFSNATTVMTTPTPSTNRETGGDSPAAENVGTKSRNNNDIIIGVVVGLGVPLVLITVFVIVWAVIKKRRSKKETMENGNDNIGGYYYDQSTVKYANSTVQRGINPDKEINEISMNVDSM